MARRKSTKSKRPIESYRYADKERVNNPPVGLVTPDPDAGDLVFDPTCGSGTTAYMAKGWGRRWITCDTSRVALTLARQRLMTAVYDYYELAHPQEGVGSGFRYKTVPHITLKSIANQEPPAQEMLYDQPFVDRKITRVSGPFTVEAVPAPAVRSLDDVLPSPRIGRGAGGEGVEASVARSGETLRQAEWRDELLKAGQHISFARLEPVFDRDHPIRATGDMSTWYTGKPCERTKKSHINFCVYDSAWEASDAYVLDHHQGVAAWVKNDHLGFEALYIYRGVVRKYRPDFLVRPALGEILVLETKGQDTEQDRVKRRFLEEWVNAVNAHGGFGRWRWEVARQPGDIQDILARCAVVELRMKMGGVL